MFDDAIHTAAAELLEVCNARGLTVATAESCTGGLLAAALTDIAGSSAVMERGFVTYTDISKQEMLGVPGETLAKHGAVSRQTAEAMSQGVLVKAPVDLAVSITGIAGPGGATPGKPVGLVHFAAASRSGELHHHEAHFGDLGRSEVRRKSVLHALGMLQMLAEAEQPRG
jgi:nicotinamide-nucleotide amidase